MLVVFATHHCQRSKNSNTQHRLDWRDSKVHVAAPRKAIPKVHGKPAEEAVALLRQARRHDCLPERMRLVLDTDRKRHDLKVVHRAWKVALGSALRVRLEVRIKHCNWRSVGRVVLNRALPAISQRATICERCGAVQRFEAPVHHPDVVLCRNARSHLGRLRCDSIAKSARTERHKRHDQRQNGGNEAHVWNDGHVNGSRHETRCESSVAAPLTHGTGRESLSHCRAAVAQTSPQKSHERCAAANTALPPTPHRHSHRDTARRRSRTVETSTTVTSEDLRDTAELRACPSTVRARRAGLRQRVAHVRRARIGDAQIVCKTSR